MGGVADEGDSGRSPGGRHDLLDLGEVRVAGLLEQARYGLGEIGERAAPVAGGGAGRIVGVHVRVAVHRSLAERNGEEGQAAAQPTRPIGTVGGVLGDEAPGRLPDVAGGRAAEGERADGGVDAVGADDQVVASVRAVGERRSRRLARLERRHRGTEPDVHVLRRVQQHVVQRRPLECDAATDACPVPLDVDLRQHPAAPVEEALPRDPVRPARDGCAEAELGECPDGVAGQVEARAGAVPALRPLDHEKVVDVSAQAERAGQREPGDPRTDDQHTHALGAYAHPHT